MSTKKSVDTGARLDAARVDLAAADRRVAEIESGEDEALDTADDHAAWKAVLADARDEVERLTRLVAKLERQAEDEANERAAKAQRKLEADAERAADAAAALLKKNHAAMVRLAHETLEAIALADRKIGDANHGRDPALDPLSSVEARVRGQSRLSRKVLSEKIVERWCYAHSSEIVPRDRLGHIVPTSAGHGVLHPSESHPLARSDGRPAQVFLRRFREVEYLPEVRFPSAGALATTLNLPAIVAGDASGWTPLSSYRPNLVLERLEQLAAAGPAADRREPEVELIPLDAAQAAE